MHLQDQPTVQEVQPTFDDARLSELIAAVRAELQSRAIWLKSQMPGAENARMSVSISLNDDGKMIDKMFVAGAWIGGVFECQCESTGDWRRAAEKMIEKSRTLLAFERFKNDIGYVPKPKPAVIAHYQKSFTQPCDCHDITDETDTYSTDKSEVTCTSCLKAIADRDADTLLALAENEWDKQKDDRRDDERERHEREQREFDATVAERFENSL